MSNKKKIVLALFIVGLFLIIWNRDLAFVNLFQNIPLDNVVYTSKDIKNNVLVLDESGTRLLKIGNDNKIIWILDNKDNNINKGKYVFSDMEENTYVCDTVNDESGIRYNSERILKYSPNGDFIQITKEYNYEEPVLVTNIAGLYMLHNEVVYVYKNDDSFSVNNIYGEVLETYPMSDVRKNVSSFGIDNETGDIFYVTYSGLVCRYIDGENDDILYDAAAQEELSVPKDVSVAITHNLYVTDIAMRDVFTIDIDGNVTRLAEKTDLYDREIAYYLNATNGFISCTGSAIKKYTFNDYEYIYDLELADKNWILSGALWFVVAFVFISGLYLLYQAIRFVIKKSNIFVKVAILVVFGVSLVSVLTFAILLPQLQERIMNGLLARIHLSAETTADQIPTEALLNIDSPDDFDGEDYNAVKSVVDRIYLSGNDSVNDLYCTLYTIQDETIISVFCIQEDTGAIYPYEWSYEESDEQYIMESQEGLTYSDKSSEGSYLFVLDPIIDEEGNSVGLIEVGTNLNNYTNQNKEVIIEMLINLFAITVVIVLIAMEIIMFAQGKNEFDSFSEIGGVWEAFPIPNGILRMIVFIIFFITNVATAFLPNYAIKLSENISFFNIPASVFAAIPISAEVVTGAIFSVFGNKIISKMGAKKASVLCAVLFSLGLLVRCIPNYWVLVAGNAVVGIGWGVILLIVNTIIAEKEDEDKDKGFSAYSAAALNGVNCGVVFGGFLFNWFSYEVIFIMSAVISLLIFLMVRRYFRNDTVTGYNSSLSAKVNNKARKAIKDDKAKKNVDDYDEKTHMSTFKFLTRWRVVLYFVMIVIPIIACGYFLNYLFPILGSEYGMTETNIGYSYLFNGLCVMAFSTILTEVLTKRPGKKVSLFMATLLYAIAFLVVARYQNIYSLFAALILLGISDCFGLPIQTSYYTDLDEVEEYGYDRAIGIYSLFENGAQAAGSFIFSYVLIIGVGTGLKIISYAIIGLAAIFLVVGLIEDAKNSKYRKIAKEIEANNGVYYDKNGFGYKVSAEEALEIAKSKDNKKNKSDK